MALAVWVLLRRHCPFLPAGLRRLVWLLVTVDIVQASLIASDYWLTKFGF